MPNNEGQVKNREIPFFPLKKERNEPTNVGSIELTLAGTAI